MIHFHFSRDTVYRKRSLGSILSHYGYTGQIRKKKKKKIKKPHCMYSTRSAVVNHQSHLKPCYKNVNKTILYDTLHPVLLRKTYEMGKHKDTS